MKKSLSNYCLFVLLSAAVGYGVMTYWVRTHQSTIEQRLQRACGAAVSVSRVQWLPLFSIVCQDSGFVFAGGEAAGARIYCPRMVLTISPLRSLLARKIIINRIECVDPALTVSGLMRLYRSLTGELNASGPVRRGFSVEIRRAQLVSDEPDQPEREAGTVLNVYFRTAASGKFRMQVQALNVARRLLGTISLAGTRIAGTSLQLTECVATAPGTTISLSGTYQDQRLVLQGAARCRMGTSAGLVRHTVDFRQNPAVYVRELFQRRPAGGTLISDLHTVVRFLPDGIRLETLRGTVPGIPFALSGFWRWSPAAAGEIRLETFPALTGPPRQTQPAAVTVSAGFARRTDWSAFMQAAGARRFGDAVQPCSAKLQIDHARIHSDVQSGWRLQSPLSGLTVRIGRQESTLALRDLQLESTVAREAVRTHTCRIRSQVFDGTVLADLQSIFLKNVPQIRGSLQLRGVSASELDSLAGLVSDIAVPAAAKNFPASIRGRTDLDIAYNGQSRPTFSAGVRIRDGVLEQSRFIRWFSERFRLPDLTGIPFDEMTARIACAADAVQVSNLRLRGPMICLAGDVSLDASGAVRGTVRLTAARSVLQRSGKFQSLLGVMDPDIQWLDFDFRISGTSRSLNFQWQENEFKRRVRQRLPAFMERRLELKVERALESVLQP